MPTLMLIWVIFALITAAVVGVLLQAMVRASGPVAGDAPHELEVYRAQLAELDVDRSRGVISEAESEAARREVARRLLAGADRTGEPSAPASPSLPLRPIAAATAIAIPLLTIGLYGGLGRPNLPARPALEQVRQTPEEMQIEALVARVEQRLRDQPQDGQGWAVLAPVYLRQGRYAEAVDAFTRANSILGDSVERLSGLASALVQAADGIVTEDARIAYEKIAALDPDRVEPHFWLAVAKEQDGRILAAADDYRALLARAPASAPWRSSVETRLNALSTRLSKVPLRDAPVRAPPSPPSDPARGPSSADVAAARDLPPGERTAMINTMVEGLAARLAADGRDVAGWQRLLRAYTVLGRREEADQALARARTALAGDAAGLATLEAFARSLGLGT